MSGYVSKGRDEHIDPSIPCLYYFPMAGRADLSRLIAAAGGLELQEVSERPVHIGEFGSPGSLPVLEHENMKIAQSTAVEAYLSSIAPKFASLTPQQRAVDLHFCAIKEDVLAGLAKELFAGKDPIKIVAHLDKWCSVIEAILPEEGFVNGLEYPTPADLAVLNSESST